MKGNQQVCRLCVHLCLFLKTEKEKKLLSIRFKVTGHLPLSFSDTHNAFCSILPKFSPLISFLPQSLFLSHHFFTWVQLLLTTFLFTFPLHTCFCRPVSSQHPSFRFYSSFFSCSCYLIVFMSSLVCHFQCWGYG